MTQVRRKKSIEAGILLDTMLSAVDERIVIVDQDGYIEALSTSYAEFLEVDPGLVVGRHVKEVIENTRMDTVAKSGIPEVGVAQVIKGEKMIASRIPIFKNGEVIGAFGRVLLRNMKDLQDLSKKMDTMIMELNLYKKAFEQVSTARYSVDDIIGKSLSIKELKEVVRQVSKTSSSILILGESGTGKELFAHAIHQASARAGAPFVVVNCGTMSQELIESELFGYVEGAFTGARKGGKQGLFQAANGGTIFLDEIGDIPLPLQVKLLRALQEREIRKIGSSVSERIDVRIIAATNKDLRSLVQEDKFRADLYYRLNVVSLNIPALRDRREDIPLLVKALSRKIAAREGVSIAAISKDAMELLTRYEWPGNVRELENVLERSINFIGKDRIVRGKHLPAGITGGDMDFAPASEKTLKEMMEAAERQVLVNALLTNGGCKTKAAKALGISRTTLYEKMAQHRLTGGNDDCEEEGSV